MIRWNMLDAFTGSEVPKSSNSIIRAVQAVCTTRDTSGKKYAVAADEPKSQLEPNKTSDIEDCGSLMRAKRL